MPVKLDQLKNVLLEGMVQIPGGIYTLGASVDDLEAVSKDPILSRRLQTNISRPVTVGAFMLGSFPVTNIQFELLFPRHKRSLYGPSDNHPVVDITFYEARSFCERLALRLPTDDEWEAAANGLGAALLTGDRNERLKNYWPSPGLNLCGEFAPNPFGLFDIIGNVYEMTHPLISTPEGVDIVSTRGGSWGTCRYGCIAPMRTYCDPLLRSNRIGFRVAI